MHDDRTSLRQPGNARWSLACLLVLAAFATQAAAGSATLHLPGAATTSAGVYDEGGRLNRTLWSGRPAQKGDIDVLWDGLDDDRQPVAPQGRYHVELLVQNIHYVWEGVIGNTSLESSGPTIHRAYKVINDLTIDEDGHAFYVVGYNEQQNGIHRFAIERAQQQVGLAHDDYRRVFRYAATDGELAYFANIGLFAPPGSPAREPATFIVALNVSDGSEYRFAAGREEMYRGQPGTRWMSVIDRDEQDLGITDGFLRAPSGLAVQRRDSRLFVSHQGLNEVRILDKRSGAFLDRIEISSPSRLAVAADDSLWILCRRDDRPAVTHFQFRDGKWISTVAISEGLERPVAIGISPVDGTVVVADAGSEQLRAFDAAGNAKWVFGRAHAYQSGDPEVREDKLWLSAGPTYVAFQPDGSFWVGDPGNARNLHFSAQRQYLDQIMYLPAGYHIAVDPSVPTRVFERYLEFTVDYSKPLAHSWKLVRNWEAGLQRPYVGDLDGFRSVTTLANGHTYGVVPRYDSNVNELLELTSSGLRPTGRRLPLGVKLYADGSLRSQEVRPGSVRVLSSRLSGFDSVGNPQWDDPNQIAGISGTSNTDPYNRDAPSMGGGNEATFPQTASGVVVSFNPGRQAGFHLGGMRPGDMRWLWRASRSGTWDIDAQGQILNRDGTFELGHGVQYAGNLVVASGRHIFYGYHGEGWNGGQAGQWMHYLDNGLFVGQFGRPVYPAINKREAIPESAGNAFSPQLVTVGTQIYLWSNDESVHAGVHRWRIDGADRIEILEAPIAP